MNTLTAEGHKKLVELLSAELGRTRLATKPKANCVGNYIEAAYLFKYWCIDINWRGQIFASPASSHSGYGMYKSYGCRPRFVAVWLELGAWDDWDVSRTPEHAANMILKFINKAGKE